MTIVIKYILLFRELLHNDGPPFKEGHMRNMSMLKGVWVKKRPLKSAHPQHSNVGNSNLSHGAPMSAVMFPFYCVFGMLPPQFPC